MSHLEGRRIYIAGKDGFLGKHLSKTVEDIGGHVLDSRRQDLRYETPDLLAYADIVINCAGQCGGVGFNVRKPATILHDNVMIGLNLINACAKISRERQYGKHLEKFISIGSACEYSPLAEIPFKEEDLWTGYPEESNGAYGISKRLLRESVKSYRQEYGLNAIHVVLANLYGPGDDFLSDDNHVIPALIRRFHKAEVENLPKVHINANSGIFREFFYVKDAAKAICNVAEKYDGGPINLGSGQEIELNELVRMICNLVGYNGSVIFEDQPYGQFRKVLDCSKATALNLLPEITDFEVGLKETYASYLEPNKAVSVNV